jgi:membrane-associated phospholipid phosphatase
MAIEPESGGYMLLNVFEKELRDSFANPFSITMGCMLLTLIVADAVLAKVVRLGGLSMFLDIWLGLVLLIACLCYCILRPLPRLIASCELTIWAVLLNNALAALILIAARSPRPLADSALAAMDGRMHISTEFFFRFAANTPAIGIALALAYSLLTPVAFAALIIPPIFGHVAASRRFALGTVVSLILLAVAFSLWPAAGPWTTERIPPTAEQSAVTSYLLRLKSSEPVGIDFAHAAVVSFPSFHVALAILAAIALSSIRRLRIWVWGLTALICVSTLTTGWHYAIDVLGGLVLAPISLLVADVLARGEYSEQRNLQRQPTFAFLQLDLRYARGVRSRDSEDIQHS